MTGLNSSSSPPLGLVAPFLLVAPLGLFAAGVLLATTDASSLAGINAPRNVAAAHAAIIGGLTTAIMGSFETVAFSLNFCRSVKFFMT